MGSDDTSGGHPDTIRIEERSNAQQIIRRLLEQASIPGADVLNISAELEAFSARAADADVAVRAQQAAVSVLEGAPDDWLHDLARARTVHTLAARLDGDNRRDEAITQGIAAIGLWRHAATVPSADSGTVATQLTLLQKLLLSLGRLADAVDAQRAAVDVLASLDPPPAPGTPLGQLESDMAETLTARLHDLGLSDEETARQVREALGRPAAQRAIAAFHAQQVGPLIVGSAKSPPTLLQDGAWRQEFRFGSILMPLGGPPNFESRWVVVVELAGLRCFGTDDPSGEDEAYLVSIVYAIDPLQQEKAVSSRRTDWDTARPGDVIGKSTQLAEGFFIPGDGSILIRLALYDRELGASDHLEKKWSDLAKDGIIGGLTVLDPAIGAAAVALDEATHLISDISDALGGAIAGIFGDDKLGEIELPIHADFLERLIADGHGLPRTSGSIPGTNYNFPELQESGPESGQWFFSGNGDGGSYRPFLSIRAARVTLSPEP
jgi:hypothetical protein